MADRYLLESSAVDGYLLEDGTGLLLLNISYGITAGADDGGGNAPSPITTTANAMNIGMAATNLVYYAYSRILALPPAQGDTIANAVLRVWSGLNPSGSPNLLIKAQAVDDATTNPADLATLVGYTRTSAGGVFSPTTSGSYDIDVTAVIQEIVNRPGWVSGGAIMFVYDNNHALDDTTNRWTMKMFETAIADERPKLFFDYTPFVPPLTPPRPFRNVNREAVHRAARW